MITVNQIFYKQNLYLGTVQRRIKRPYCRFIFELLTSPIKNGHGLSAIQINIPYRVAILRSKKCEN